MGPTIHPPHGLPSTGTLAGPSPRKRGAGRRGAPRAHSETATPFPWNRHRDRLRPDQPGRSRMRRREFIAGLGSVAAWPFASRAQQGDRVRRIGVLMPYDENDPVWNAFVSAFTQALVDLGWTDGRNVRMDLRWA